MVYGSWTGRPIVERTRAHATSVPIRARITFYLSRLYRSVRSETATQTFIERKNGACKDLKYSALQNSGAFKSIQVPVLVCSLAKGSRR